MALRVCIPTAGIGSRLGNLTKNLNKSLVSVDNKPVLAHQIDMFPPDTEFVIALGHKGDLVREFLSLAYPERTFFFSEVSPYQGEGSGLGLSLLSCQEYLQQPFILISCDTLVRGDIPLPDHNWMGYADVRDVTQYRTLKISQGCVLHIAEKTDLHNGPEYKAYIGIAGISDFKTFWHVMAQGSSEAVLTGEVYGLRELLGRGVSAKKFIWFDTGNPDALKAARTAYVSADAPNILEKTDEALWFVGSHVIKFSYDKNFIQYRVQRAEILGAYVPQITASSAHMYSYRKCQGNILSDVVSLPIFKELLAYANTFWKNTAISQSSEFRSLGMKFYRDKTYARVKKFYQLYHHADDARAINGIEMPTLQSMLDRLDWNWLSDGLWGTFHGDFHFENILYTGSSPEFVFLDWRQNFGGSLNVGDIYYDLAKLMHGLIVSHGMIARNQYSASWDGGVLKYDLHRRQILVECERYFLSWLEENGYDVRKVCILTALIYLNIAGLHHYPYCLLLYGLGKYMLYQHSIEKVSLAKGFL